MLNRPVGDRDKGHTGGTPETHGGRETQVRHLQGHPACHGMHTIPDITDTHLNTLAFQDPGNASTFWPLVPGMTCMQGPLPSSCFSKAHRLRRACKWKEHVPHTRHEEVDVFVREKLGPAPAAAKAGGNW